MLNIKSCLGIFPIYFEPKLVKNDFCACCEKNKSQYTIIFSQWYFQNYCRDCIADGSSFNWDSTSNKNDNYYRNHKTEYCDGCNKNKNENTFFLTVIDKTGGIGLNYCKECTSYFSSLVGHIKKTTLTSNKYENNDQFIDKKDIDLQYQKRSYLPKGIRHEVLKRDNYSCRECGAKKDEITLEVDHIIPFSRGGTDEISNLQTLCKICNRQKSNLYFYGGMEKFD